MIRGRIIMVVVFTAGLAGLGDIIRPTYIIRDSSDRSGDCAFAL